MTKIKTKEDLLDALRNFGANNHLAPRPEEGEFTVKEYIEANGVSESQARRDIRKGLGNGTVIKLRIYLPGDCSRIPVYKLVS